ncbi:uncharacterized protein nrm isoform X6 [Drosophila takahashii]|uniref:uncharacterized protein nrm isoform X6 n=1 Tax=Drosophila takahashii TaxID=29030 RepID=UPI00389940DF
MAPKRTGKGIPMSKRVILTAPISTSLVLLVFLALFGHSSAQVDTTISQQESFSVVLPCPVNVDKCGKLHSLNWFKGDDRIAAMLLGESNVTSVNKEFDERVTVQQNPYRLVIKDLKIADEDIYLCDTTFFIPEETCDNFNGYRVELRVLVPPTEIVILDAKGDRIENGSVVGPMQERQSLKATCTVKNTRPQPEVGWFRGDKRLTTYSPTHDLNDGLYTSTLELDWPLSREDLAQDIECRVNSAAIPNTTVTKFSVDLQVRPTRIDINGVKHHTVQGSKVVLTCDIQGARPAVNLTWYNSSILINPDDNDITEIRIKSFEKKDGTYHTQSELIFNATRFENDRVFRCEAENVVLQINREKPISSVFTLEVLYPPVVKVSPSAIMTNTSEIVLLNCEYVANPASLTQVEWYRNDDLVNVNDTNHYKGGNSENVALVIKSTAKDDIGNYSCQLSNTIGKGISDQKINLDVQYVPSVEILMIPEGPVRESDESNVTLFCNVLDANPLALTKVRWYANSTLLKELPDCEETREDLCHIDPSKLLLESIGRGFFYNYSCEGYNSAGWGPRSEDKELLVHYEPGPSALTHFPLVAVKKKSVTFSCSVDDPGYPDSNRFVTKPVNHNYKKIKTQHAPLIEFHTVEALQPQEADIAFEALLLNKIQKSLPSTASPQISPRNLEASASLLAHEIKETHALIDLHLNHSHCTLLTLTTYTPQSQFLTLYTGIKQKNDSIVSPSSYALYRKMGKFSFDAQIVSKPNRYRWLRGGRGPLQDIVTKDWTVEPVGLDSRTNYSCYAYNEGGKGIMATVNLEVHAPPFFIKNLPPYTGVLHSSQNATLTCRIECVPRCDISWQKDGEPIERNDTRYFIKEKYMEASPATGDFESMLSVLHFNMSNWPLGKFDIEADNANYECVSTGNTVGASIRSRTYFGIEYAPDNTTVSENILYVQEDTIPGRILCKSRANPEPLYKWFFKNETIANGNALIINTAMKRNDNGTYTCQAYNKHGKSIAETVIEVQFKPRCEIERREIDDQDTLICTAYGNPLEADFSWSIKGENDTVQVLGSGEKKTFLEKSFYILQTDYAISRTYRCVSNNTVGSAPFCEIEVAEQLAWWQLWEKNTLIIIVAVILGLLLTVIIICCIIICICRRRRRQDKLHDKSSSLGEPLTEPGEYENLPFHGLQTAPNKSSTTPTNFNNNTSAMRTAQRLKGLNANINLPSVNHQQDRQNTQDLQLIQEQHFCDHGHRSQNNTIPCPSSTDQNNQKLTELDSNQLNLTNCFPKSYSEYTQQNQQKHQIQIKLQAGTTQMFNTNSFSDDQLTNAIERDCLPSYPSMCRSPSIPRSALLSTNPFLDVTNFKKYGEDGEDLSGSMPREKYSKSVLDVENKFYSLKFPGGSKLKNRSYNENSLGSIPSHTPSALDVCSLSTCKTHNFIACNSQSDIDPSVQPVCIYDPPAYENMVAKGTADQSTESIKIDSNDLIFNSNQHRATVQLDSHLGKDVIRKHHHRHHRHQQKKDEGIAADLKLIEPERITIYRSDSGISNSSYESQFPIPLSQKRTKITKNGSVNSTSSSLIRKHGIKNVEAHNSGSIPVESSNILSSESKVIKSGVPSLSACASSSHCMLNQTPSTQYNDKTTGEDFEQHRLGHQCVYSVSTPLVCNSLNTSSKSNYRLTAQLKCSNVQTPNKKKKLLAINPFLVKYKNDNTYTGDKNNRKQRRQTISNPYEHIQRRQGDVSRKTQGYRSDAFKAFSYGHKCDSGDSQTTSTEKMEIINNAAKTTYRKFGNDANRTISEGVLVSKKLMIQTSRLGSVAGIDNYPPEISSNLTSSPADEEYDCLVVRRPIRLPLRKHHTFHFHSTQTANSMLHELRERHQLQLQEREFEKQNVPLVFSPLELSEQHAFKPISPTPTMTALAEQGTSYQNHHLNGTEDDEDLGYSFCEEECMVDNDNYPTSDNLSTAPANSTITSKAIKNSTAGALEYFMSQSSCEVHI